MSQRKVLLVVEGQHDEAFIAKILRERHGFVAKTKLSQIDPYWKKTVPEKFPFDDDLRRRMPVPYFYVSDDVSLSIIVADGESRLVEVVGDTLSLLQGPVDAIGVVLDADVRKPVEERFEAIRKGLLECGLTPGDAAGVVSSSTPNCGIYVLPDNATSGTLENVLLECAEKNYQAALGAAGILVESVDLKDYQPDDLREFRKPAGKNKAKIAAITAILKPGKTAQASISDNRWLHGEALALVKVRSFAMFLEGLLAGQEERSVTPPPATQARR